MSLRASDLPTRRRRTPPFMVGTESTTQALPITFCSSCWAHPPNFITQSVSFTQKNPTPVTDVFVANPSAAGITPQTLALHMPDVYAEEFNLLVEHTFAEKYSITLGYAGETGKHSSVAGKCKSAQRRIRRQCGVQREAVLLCGRCLRSIQHRRIEQQCPGRQIHCSGSCWPARACKLHMVQEYEYLRRR